KTVAGRNTMSQETLPEFGISKNIKQIARTDLPGGGLVTVENGYAYVGHIDPPYGTSIVDVHDPKHPKLVSQLEVPEGIHSHKVRVSDDVMLVNYERYQTKKSHRQASKSSISQTSRSRARLFFSKPPAKACIDLRSMAGTLTCRRLLKVTSATS